MALVISYFQNVYSRKEQIGWEETAKYIYPKQQLMLTTAVLFGV